ncbi:MAG: type III polyketide synthase [Myxococcota bacterium]
MAELVRHFPGYDAPAVRRIFQRSGVERRHFAIGPGGFDPKADADQMLALYGETAPRLSIEVARRAIERARASLDEIGLVVVATCTGYICPGLTAHVVRGLKLPEDVQRADLVGMGCAGALPALQRGVDYVLGHSGKKALVVCVEVCSACWYVDESVETLVGNAICADGGAAVVLDTNGQDGPRICDFATGVDTEWMSSVGLVTKAGRHRIILSKGLRKAAGPVSKRVIQRLLDRHGIARGDVRHWVFHAGGRAVLDSIETAMELPAEALATSREILRNYGNMSSPTVLFVLDAFRQRAPSPGDIGVALALGPGLAAEAALLRW